MLLGESGDLGGVADVEQAHDLPVLVHDHRPVVVVAEADPGELEQVHLRPHRAPRLEQAPVVGGPVDRVVELHVQREQLVARRARGQPAGHGVDQTAEGTQVAAYRLDLGGQPVTLEVADDQGTEDGARAAVEQLVNARVSGIVAATTGDHVLPALADAAAADTAVLLPYLRTDADLILRKGFRRAVDSYSAFFENDHETPTGLQGYLRARGVEAVTLVGLATDYCVSYSALDAARLGFRVTVLTGLTRPIDLGGSLAQARAGWARAGVVVA